MRILYGVVGEGMGHAMRSRVVLEHLIAQGHEIEVMVSGRAAEFLRNRFDGVRKIHGLHMIYEENRVRKGRTLWSNVVAGLTGVPENIGAYFDLLGEFRPEVVVSDFESWTWLYAKNHRLPVISVDNMQIINRCAHEPEIIEGDGVDFQIAKAFVKAKLPWCSWYLVTTFFRPPVRKSRTSLHPPILRPEILAATPTRGEHLLVYQTAEGNDGLLDALRATGMPCRVYGMRRGITDDVVEGALTHRPFSEVGFIDDLSSCRAVVAGGGFTLMGEAVYLHKPMLAVPLAGQFEQMINARYLQREGFGRWARDLSDPATLKGFLDAIPACEARLVGYSQDGNRDLLGALDGLLAKAEAGDELTRVGA